MRTFFDLPNPLPDECLLGILSYINPFRITTLASVSKKFYTASNSSFLWLQFYKAEFGALPYQNNIKIQYFAAVLFREAENCKRTEKAQLLYQKMLQLIKPYDSEPWTHFYNGKMRYYGLGLPCDKLQGLWYFNMNFHQSVDEIASLLIELDTKNRKFLLKDLAVIELISKLLDIDPFSEIGSLINELRKQGIVIADLSQSSKIQGKNISDLSIKDLGTFLGKNVSLQSFQDIIHEYIQQLFSTLIEKYKAGSDHLAYQIGKLYVLEKPFTNELEADFWLKKAMLTEPEAVHDFIRLHPENDNNQIPQYDNNQAIIDYNIGYDLLNESKISSAVKKFELSAAAGYLPAKTSLGEIYYHLHSTIKGNPHLDYYQMAVDELFSAFTAGESNAGNILYAMLPDLENNVDIALFKKSFFAGNWQAVRQIGQFYLHLLSEDHIENPTNILWLQLASQYNGKKPFPILERLVKEENPYACVALGILYTYGICDSILFKPDANEAELYWLKALELDPEIGFHYLELVRQEVSCFETASSHDLILPEIEQMLRQRLIVTAAVEEETSYSRLGL